MIAFNIINGLNYLIAGARFKGDAKNNTEEEYNNLEQIDPRPKPTQYEVYDAAVQLMRNQLKDEINLRTDELIEFGQIFDDGESTQPIHLGIEEQINLDTMDRLRNELDQMGIIVFPYLLKVSDNVNGEGNYIKLLNADHFHMFFLTGIGYKNRIIESGRALKDLLGMMDKTALESFRDTR